MRKEKEVMYTVYQHRNLRNGKSYIGMTSLNPKRRWNSGKGYKNQPKIWSDIKKSDWNTDWEHNILGKFEDKQEALNLEEMFIQLFDSTNDGYNISSYGNSHYERTEEHKKKISEANTGKHFSEEHKKKISESKTGKHLSEEHKKRVSASMTGNHNSPTKPVLQYSKSGELIAEYPSTREAERYTGCHQQSICQCCKGKLKTCGGYIWKYKKI